MHPQAVMTALHRGQVLAAPIAASDAAYLAWVGIYPLDTSRASTVEFLKRQNLTVPGPDQRLYRVRVFEVPRVLIDDDVCVSEEEMLNSRSCVVFGDEGLLSQLGEVGVRLDDLELPSKSDYPI